MKTVCMIPVRANSKRIPKKNLRLLNGIPLVAYAIKAAKESHVFDEIWVNSENEIFKELADEYGVKFYKRPEEYATDQSTNDDFMYDFLRHVDCDKVVQLLCTSPFITPQEVRDFYFMFKDNPFDTLISVKDVRIECLYNDRALNFSRTKHTQPSQELIPVQAYACSIMAWDRNLFVRNYETSTGAYHGGSGKTGYYTLSGLSTLDIDTEFDWQVAEGICKGLEINKPFHDYYGNGIVIEMGNPTVFQTPETYDWSTVKTGSIEWDVQSILKRDGVVHNNLFDSNKLIANIQTVIDSNSKTESWSHRFIDSENNSITAISAMNGESNRLHFHPDWCENWIIWQGSFKFTIEGEEKVVGKNDIVFIEKGKQHKIEALEDNSIRLAISRADVKHVYQ